MVRDPDDDVKRVLSDMRELGFKALEMVAGLLDVEDLEEGLLIADPAEVAVDHFIHSISSHQRTTALARELSLEFAVPNGMVAHFDRQLISRVVENLVDNSVRYAPFGGRVRISAELDDGTLILRVGNDGPPVPEAQRDKLFERYYRIDARRAGARANRGLGLYFCKLAVEAHQGTIGIEQLEEYPACFAVRLPQQASAA
jgi:signal transduction histidine kinase